MSQLELVAAEQLGSEGERRSAIMKGVDRGLDILGRIGKPAVLVILAREFKLRRQDVPDRPEQFTAALGKMFGSGAGLIESSILDGIRQETGSAVRYWSFADAVRALGFGLTEEPGSVQETGVAPR